MKAVLLDADTLGDDIDLAPIRKLVTELRVFATTSPQQLMERLGDAELILTNKVVIHREALVGRKGIFVLATGMNNIDLAAAAENNIPVYNVHNYGTNSVAQHTLMLILALASKLPMYEQELVNGSWQTSPFFCLMNHKTVELCGKTLVIVGEGNLGSAVGKLAEAFGMNVVFCARPGKSGDIRPSLDSLLGVADVLSFHCPLSEETRHLLNAARLGKINSSCLVVNCARGAVIDENAALDALCRGQIAGLAVDVLPEEPPVNGHRLLDSLGKGYNLLVTPHNAWISREARQKIIELTAENIQSLTADPGC